MNRIVSVGALVYIVLGLIYGKYPVVDLGPIDVTTTQLQLGASGIAGLLAGLYKHIWALISQLKLPSVALPFMANGVEKLLANLAAEEVKAAKAGNPELVKELTEARLALLKRVK